MIKIILEQSKTFGFVLFVLIATGCSSNPSTTEEGNGSSTETELEEAIFTPVTLAKLINQLELDLANPNMIQKENIQSQLVDFYDSYFHLFPEDSLSPDMLFKAGNQCVNLQRYDVALSYYDRIDVSYPNYQKRPESLFLQGFVYGSYKNQLGKAKDKYERLIELYPNHVFALQAKQSIENLGLTDMEIIQKFDKNQ